jgi:hypothetical protein
MPIFWVWYSFKAPSKKSKCLENKGLSSPGLGSTGLPSYAMADGGFWPEGTGFDCSYLKVSFFCDFPLNFNSRNKLRPQNWRFDGVFGAVVIFLILGHNYRPLLIGTGLFLPLKW